MNEDKNIKKNKKTELSSKTTEALLSIARRHFSRYGYSDTSLEKIVSEMNMTRGALYHHFKNKKALFLAVLKQVQEEIGKKIEEISLTSDDLWEQLILGCVAFVELAILESNKRILLIDAPSVIEWNEWKKLDNANSQSALEEQLLILKEARLLADLDVSLISSLISGALNELSLRLAQSDISYNKDIRKAVTLLLQGFKISLVN